MGKDGWVGEFFSNGVDSKTFLSFIINRNDGQFDYLLQDKYILIIIRYLESIEQFEYDVVIKLLLLLVQLLQYSDSRLANHLSHFTFSNMRFKRTKELLAMDYSFFQVLTTRLSKYIDYLTACSTETWKELDILTEKYVDFSQCSFSRNQLILVSFKKIQDFIESKFILLDRSIKYDIAICESMSEQNFISFYFKYCKYCGFRKKIYKSNRKDLSVAFSFEKIVTIEKRYQQINTCKPANEKGADKSRQLWITQAFIKKQGQDDCLDTHEKF